MHAAKQSISDGVPGADHARPLVALATGSRPGVMQRRVSAGFTVSVVLRAVPCAGVVRLEERHLRACRCSHGHRPGGCGSEAKVLRATLPAQHRSGVADQLTRTRPQRACRLQKPCSLPIASCSRGIARVNHLHSKPLSESTAATSRQSAGLSPQDHAGDQTRLFAARTFHPGRYTPTMRPRRPASPTKWMGTSSRFAGRRTQTEFAGPWLRRKPRPSRTPSGRARMCGGRSGLKRSPLPSHCCSQRRLAVGAPAFGRKGQSGSRGCLGDRVGANGPHLMPESHAR